VKIKIGVLGEGSTCRGDWFRRKKKKGVEAARLWFYWWVRVCFYVVFL
jgi:hypothetical protein